MAKTFLLEVVIPGKVVVSTQVEEMTAPGVNGEFGVFPGHTLFTTLISVGELSYSINGHKQSLVVGEGFAEVTHDAVTVIVDSVENA